MTVQRARGQWCEVGDQRFYARSGWEASYAETLERRRRAGEIVSWQHEAVTFWFDGIQRGTRSYLPDFRVVLPDGQVEYHEVKGYWTARFRTQMRRMHRYHPEVRIRIIDRKQLGK